MCDDEPNKCPLSISDWITIIENEISNNDNQSLLNKSFIYNKINLIFNIFVVVVMILIFRSNVTISYIFNVKNNLIETNSLFKIGSNFDILSYLLLIFFISNIIIIFILSKKKKDVEKNRDNLIKLREKIINREIVTSNKIRYEYLRITNTK